MCCVKRRGPKAPFFYAFKYVNMKKLIKNLQVYVRYNRRLYNRFRNEMQREWMLRYPSPYCPDVYYYLRVTDLEKKEYIDYEFDSMKKIVEHVFYNTSYSQTKSYSLIKKNIITKKENILVLKQNVSNPDSIKIKIISMAL